METDNLELVKDFLKSTGNDLVSVCSSSIGPLSTEIILKLLDYKRVAQVERSLEGLPFFMKTPPHILIPDTTCGGFRLVIPNADISEVPFKPEKVIKPANIFLGIDDKGQDLTLSLNDVTHSIIAGATGSGKSMCIHAMLHSLLVHGGVDIAYLDPKRVESQLYSGLAKDGLISLASSDRDILSELNRIHNWMEDRYREMANAHVRDAMSQWIASGGKDFKPMVLVCDEVGDMFMEIPEAKNILLSLSSKARAAGLRIFLATQRPDAKIIDGGIKANFTTRICFKTSSKIDSFIVLGFSGGEHLRGKGHGILLTGDGKIVTFKGAIVNKVRLNKYSISSVPQANAPAILESSLDALHQLKKVK